MGQWPTQLARRGSETDLDESASVQGTRQKAKAYHGSPEQKAFDNPRKEEREAGAVTGEAWRWGETCWGEPGQLGSLWKGPFNSSGNFKRTATCSPYKRLWKQLLRAKAGRPNPEAKPEAEDSQPSTATIVPSCNTDQGVQRLRERKGEIKPATRNKRETGGKERRRGGKTPS